jgi:hypothetical protein
MIHLVSKGREYVRMLLFGSRMSRGMKGITAAKRRKSRKRTTKTMESLKKGLSFFDAVVRVVME